MQRKRSVKPATLKQMPAWLIAILDILAIGVALLVFAVFDHVVPHYDQAVEYAPPVQESFAMAATPVETGAAPAEAAEPQADAAAPAEAEQSAPDEGEAQPMEAAAPEADGAVEAAEADVAAEADGVEAAAPDPELIAQQAAVGNFSAKFADKFTDGEVIHTANSYQSPNLNITITRGEGKLGKYNEVYFVQDIYIRNIDCLRTILAKDSFGRSLSENVVKMSERASAVCAINADFYSFRSRGLVIRNGVLYRDKLEPDNDVLVIYRNGDMKVFPKGANIDVQQLMADGAWQSFSFGPSLLNESGELRSSYKNVNHDPRTIIGMIEPGHYLFIVVDGRRSSYSAGVTYYESALLAKQLGCTVAYNLDGGKTTQMLYGSKVINNPYKGGRNTSDLICIVDIVR